MEVYVSSCVLRFTATSVLELSTRSRLLYIIFYNIEKSLFSRDNNIPVAMCV